MFESDTLTLLIQYKYWIIIPLAFFEGPAIAVMVGFLGTFGYFSLLPAYLILTVWDVVRDLFYYYLGKVTHHKDFLKKYGGKLHLTEDHFIFIERLWYRHTHKTMLFAKLAFGLSAIILMTAGAVRLPLARFARSAIGISMVEYAVFILLGWHFARFYLTLSAYVNYAQYAAAAIAILFVFVYVFFAFRAKSALLKTIEGKTPIM